MDDVYQKIIDLTRGRLDIKRLKTIFGRKKRPYNHKSKGPKLEVCIEKLDYNLTVFKIHFGRLTVKIYDKGERTLRAEVVVHNTKDLKCKRVIESFEEIVEKLETIMGSFLSNIDHAHIATINDGSFEEISQPTQTGKKRLAGIDFNKERTKQVASILLALSMKPGGFTSKNLSDEMNQFNQDFTIRNASYDIRKFRGKKMVKKIGGSIKYIITKKGITIIASILCMLKKQMPSMLAIVNSEWKGAVKNELLEMDRHLINVANETEKIWKSHGITQAA